MSAVKQLFIRIIDEVPEDLLDDNDFEIITTVVQNKGSVDPYKLKYLFSKIFDEIGDDVLDRKDMELIQSLIRGQSQKMPEPLPPKIIRKKSPSPGGTTSPHIPPSHYPSPTSMEIDGDGLPETPSPTTPSPRKTIDGDGKVKKPRTEKALVYVPLMRRKSEPIPNDPIPKQLNKEEALQKFISEQLTVVPSWDGITMMEIWTKAKALKMDAFFKRKELKERLSTLYPVIKRKQDGKRQRSDVYQTLQLKR